jgi:hypothetical protein
MPLTLPIGRLAAKTGTTEDHRMSMRMSGNLCRCGAHSGIVAAIAETSLSPSIGGRPGFRATGEHAAGEQGGASTFTQMTKTPQIQYSQQVLLNFNGLSWPHVSVATLVPASPVPVPASVFT